MAQFNRGFANQRMAIILASRKKPELISKAEKPAAWKQSSGGSLSQKVMNQRVYDLLTEKQRLSENLPSSKKSDKFEADRTKMVLNSMKLTQLDDLARIKPHFSIRKTLIGANAIAFLAYISGISSNDYFTPGHTNTYCLIMSYASTLLFTLGAGGLFGL